MGKIIQAWQKTPNGSGVSFNQSYGASTDQARAVANGLKADVVFLSTGDDVNLLVDAGLVDSNWSHQGYSGIAADTVVVFAVRNGNPKHIKSWADLTRPGVQVLTPNPFSSGSAKWNILAAYGAERRLGKTDKQATAYVQQLFKHVVVQDTSGRNATNTFLSGKGDVLITYESEAINSRLNGQDIQYVIPRQSMLIELPIAVTKSSSNKDKATQFIQYVKGPAVAGSVRAIRLPSGRQEDPRQVRIEVSGAAGHLQGRRQDHRRLAERRQALVRPEQGSHGGDRTGNRGTFLWLAPPHAAPLTGRAAGRPSERAATALSLGFTTAFLSVIVVLPIAALDLGVARERAVAVLVGRHATGGRRGAQAEPWRRADRLARQCGARDDHRLGARPRRLPR